MFLQITIKWVLILLLFLLGFCCDMKSKEKMFIVFLTLKIFYFSSIKGVRNTF